MKSAFVWAFVVSTLLSQASAQVSAQDNDGHLTQRDVFLSDYERLGRGETVVEYDKGAWPPGMTFDFGQTTLKPYTISVLNEAIEALKKYPELTAELSGHTDSVGSESENQKLSIRRATVAYKYLIRHGIAPSRLKPVGYGESRPISPNTEEDGSDNPNGRAKNRRIELNVKT